MIKHKQNKKQNFQIILILLILFLFSASVSAQSISFKVVEREKFNNFNINDPKFSNGPNGYDGVLPVFSTKPKPVVHNSYNTNVIFESHVYLPDLSNAEFADLIIGEGVFYRPRVVESNTASQFYEHIVGGFFENTIYWENKSEKYYFYEFDDVKLANEELMVELSRRLEQDSDFLNNYFNLDYNQSFESKGSEMIRRKFWEFYGVYDYESRCYVFGESGSRKGFFDYYYCTPNIEYKDSPPTALYIDWRTKISSDEALQNIIRLSYYDFALDKALVDTHSNIIPYTSQIDSATNICDRLRVANDLSKNTEGLFLTIDQMRSFLDGLSYDSYERLRISVFSWFYLNNKECDDVSLAGVFEEGKGQAGKTLYGIRNYAFNLKDITSFILRVQKDKSIVFPSDEDILAQAKIKYLTYDPKNQDPFSKVFTSLIKFNYPSTPQTINSIVYSSNFHNESFTFFSDVRIKSLDNGVVTIQDKYFDPVVFSKSEFDSKNIEDVRSISFNLENFKDIGAAIRSGSSFDKDLTGCLLFLGKNYCDGFINITYSSLVSRFGEFQKVLNIEGVNSFNLDHYKTESGTIPLLVDIKGSSDNPIKILFEGKEFVVSGNTQFDMSSVSSVSGMNDIALNGRHKLGELNIRVNSGSVDVFDSKNKKIVEFNQGTNVAMYSIMKPQGTGWVNDGDAKTLLLRSGSMNTFDSNGLISASLSSGSKEVFASFGLDSDLKSRCKSLRVSDCSGLIIPEVVSGSSKIINLINHGDLNYFEEKDLDLNFVSIDDDLVVSYFSDFDGELRTTLEPLSDLKVYGDVSNNGVLGFVDGWDIYRGGENLIFTRANVAVSLAESDLVDNLFMSISSPDVILFGNNQIILNQKSSDAFTSFLND